MARRFLLPAFAALLCGCAVIRGQPGIVVASEPPGASILVDGQDSGYATPTAMYLPRADWHRIDVDLPGYRRETRIVGPGVRFEVIPWRAGLVLPISAPFPLWLDVPALFVPLRVDDNLQPSRIFVRLVLERGQ